MSEPTMPRERVSRERREAIGKALHRAHCAAWDDIESADEEWADPVIQHEFMAQADAAIAAILPERTAFRKQVESIIEARFKFADDPCELWEGEWMQRWHDMEVMVFGESDVWDHYFDPNGDDDASGGTR